MEATLVESAPAIDRAAAPPVYHVVQQELGIGDIVCSLYALNGFSLALERPVIVLYMRDHFGWLELIDIPNLHVVSADRFAAPAHSYLLGDTEADYREKLRTGPDAKQWYARKLGVTPVAPPLRQAMLDAPTPIVRGPYVVLAPFATRINRTWETHNWRLLARDLMAAGYGVIALDGPHQSERCKPIGVDYFYGQAPAWVANVCHKAAAIVTGDSGLAHVGGLLGTRTLVLLAQQRPERHFSMTRNEFMVPASSCAGCRFQPELGYEEKCDFGCWALQSISPRDVAARVLQMLDSG